MMADTVCRTTITTIATIQVGSGRVVKCGELSSDFDVAGLMQGICDISASLDGDRANRRHSIPPRLRGESRAKRAGWVCFTRESAPHPASLGYRLREATLPEDGEG